ncbi:Molybdopterin molybdenumtransferase [Serratia proteamaculans]|nr:Molybdopterin molybdenumtransferase [Serratia proteamaculans]
MDHCHTSDLISLEQALEKMLSQLSPLQQTESIALTAAAGRITAAPVISPIDVPRSPIRRWTVTPCASPICRPMPRCR